MKKRKMSRATQVFLSLGLVLTSGTTILLDQFPGMPAFVRGGLEGLGLGLMIIGLVKLRRGGSDCATMTGTGKESITHEISVD